MTSLIWHRLPVRFDTFYFFRVKGTLHAFKKISAENGILGLWKGWLPNVQRAAIVNLGGKKFSRIFWYFGMVFTAGCPS